MGEARAARPVNLICGALSAREDWIAEARRRLERALGAVDLESELWPFDFTDYYAHETGRPLVRRFFSFRDLVGPETLASAKLTTNGLEKVLACELAEAPERPVNLDPGYVALDKLVLATTKDYGHRVYLGDGVYAESTLRWRDGAFEPWEWTYPDYRTDHYRAFFARVRALYSAKLARAEA